MQKLKIAFIYGKASSNGKIFNIPNLLNDPAGLTGSETNFFYYARALAKRGHEVAIIMHPSEDSRLLYYGYPERNFETDFDVVYSWNEPAYLYKVSNNTLKILNCQINSLNFSLKGEKIQHEEFIDLYTSPSDHHKNYMQSKSSTPEKWHTIPNCVDPSWFNLNLQREEFTLMYASSPDRGLCWLLQCYPDIKKEVPKAKLKIFYDYDKWYNNLMLYKGNEYIILENQNRAKYINYALKEMSFGFGIEHHKNISKKQLCEEMCKTKILAYPCSITNEYTEGFSCTTMEACAAGMVPVVSSQDALGELYGNSAIVVDSPIENNLDKFIENIIIMLTNDKEYCERQNNCLSLSKNYYFNDEVVKLEQLIYNNLKI